MARKRKTRVYKVVETCKATIRTTYTVEAASPEEAEEMVRKGDAGEAIETEDYDHQYPEYEIETAGEFD